MTNFLRSTVVLFVMFAALAGGFWVTRPTPEQRADILLVEAAASWTDPAERAATIRELRAFNPEWDFMRRTFLALSLVDRSLAHPEEADRWLPVIDDLLATTISEQAEHGDAHFLLDYVNDRPFRDPTGRSVFVDGEIALVLGARRFVRDDPAVAARHRQLVTSLAGQFVRSPAFLPESYPDEAWLFCNTNALVAIRMADALDGTDHSALIDAWLARAHTDLVDPTTGLLGSEYSWTGAPHDGPEGSSVWLVAANLRLLDPPFADAQYAAAREALVGKVLGLGYAREWPAGGLVDVDSGPLVPFIEASPSSSGFALLAARAFGDDRTFSALGRSLAAADLLVRVDPRLAALADNPMGDVIVLHALTFGPLWERIARSENADPS